MRLRAAAILAAALAFGTFPAAPAEPERAVPSRPQPGDPAPRDISQTRRDPTSPPPAWRAAERATPAVGRTPPARGQPWPAPPPPPALLPPPAPLPPLPPPAAPATPPPAASPPQTQAPAAPEPPVEHLGVVSGPTGTFAILRIAGKVHVLPPGAGAAGVQVLAVDTGAGKVVLKVNGKKREIRPGGRTGAR